MHPDKQKLNKPMSHQSTYQGLRRQASCLTRGQQEMVEGFLNPERYHPKEGVELARNYLLMAARTTGQTSSDRDTLFQQCLTFLQKHPGSTRREIQFALGITKDRSIALLVGLTRSKLVIADAQPSKGGTARYKTAPHASSSVRLLEAEILESLAQKPERCQKLAQRWGLKTAALSGHLVRLEKKGVVKKERIGKNIYWSVNKGRENDGNL